MPERTKTIIAILLVAAIVAASFGTGWFVGSRTSSEPALDSVRQVWDLIFTDYVDKGKLDPEALAQGAIRGMVEALDDPYSVYLEPAVYELSQRSLEGRIQGIGAYVTAEEGQVVIVSPVAGSPAEAAGIRAGDIILEVDGAATAELSLVEVVLRVQGPKGTPVSLLILHEGETEPELLEIIRAEIELPSIIFEMMEDIAYINVTHFTERTAIELVPVMTEENQQASGIILDLRSNPGGLLDAVVGVAGFFLEEVREWLAVFANVVGKK